AQAGRAVEEAASGAVESGGGAAPGGVEAGRRGEGKPDAVFVRRSESLRNAGRSLRCDESGFWRVRGSGDYVDARATNITAEAQRATAFADSCFFIHPSLRPCNSGSLGVLCASAVHGTMADSELTHGIIGAAIDVHRALGPGLLESAYEECLCHELGQRVIGFERQKPIPLVYKDVKLECGYRIEVLVGGRIVVEVKAVDALAP